MSKEKDLKDFFDKTDITPICAECKYCYPYIEKGFFKKIRHAGCSAQGYVLAKDVYGSMNCKGAYNFQLKYKQEKINEV